VRHEKVVGGWKLLTRRTIAAALFLIALAIATIGALLSAYFAAPWLSSPPALLALSVVVFAAIAWLGMRMIAAVWRANRQNCFAMIFASCAAVVFCLFLYFNVVRSSASRALGAAPAFAHTRYWQLPTGSRIAYSEFDPATRAATKPYPIIFLHGGPGIAQEQPDQDFYSGFTAQGFRVYLYDQAGSGLSGVLPVGKYKVQQAVEDLDAIRQTLGAEKVILIGHSWGSTLAASYIAEYPGRVAKVVFHSPGPIWHLLQLGQQFDYSRTDFSGKTDPPPLRLLAAMFLQMRNPVAAENMLPQAEADQLFLTMTAHIGGAFVCKGDSAKLPGFVKQISSGEMDPRFNPYVQFRYNLQTENSAGDPHEKLRGSATPALLLFPECNYLPWTVTLDYRKTFSNLTVIYVPRAGHSIHFEQPELMRQAIVDFLLDQPYAHPPYTSDTDPRR